MRVPQATYRLQLTPEFGFARVRAALDYLQRLGVSDLYLSPVLRARSGSTHGYDVVDPAQVNPALGGRDELERLADDARARDMGIVLDIVPNHMAASRENAWWWDVLQRGRESEFARVFDVDWERGDGRVVLPLDEVPARGSWRRGRANYRRFFDIDDLVAVRVEDPWVFELTHSLIVDLVRSGVVTGLRVDHVDGLRDPAAYLRRLPDTYVVVEKILERDEDLPRDWDCQGTTGYEFIDRADGLFVDRVRGARAFERVAESAKRQIVLELFESEVDALAERLGGGREAVVELTVALDVYRTYGTLDGFAAVDRRRIRSALERARRRVRDRPALESVGRLLVTHRRSPAWADIVARWQQLSGPAMAKGYEDTALYRFPKLTSRNEVGCDPARPAIAVDEFHSFNAGRLRRWPHAMNAGSTHDTKRGEDVRARISVLSEMPAEWDAVVARWVQDEPPSADDQHLFFQSLVGAWPVDAGRMCAVMQKSVREAKIHTSWRESNTDYERAVEGFVRGVFADRRLIEEVVAVVKKISPAALVNSLAGVVLRIASPGVPDVYQGAEHWYTRLVDPDNRVAVDFSATVPEKMPAPTDPKIKTHVLSRGLHARREHPDLFASGSYVAIEASGRLRRHVVAFARRRGSDWALACVPRLVARLGTPVGDVWQGTRLVMPSSAPRRWHNVLTDETVASTDLADVLHELPVAIMLA